MMTFTITDFLISLPITAIIIFAIKLVYKRAGISATPMGCLTQDKDPTAEEYLCPVISLLF